VHAAVHAVLAVVRSDARVHPQVHFQIRLAREQLATLCTGPRVAARVHRVDMLAQVARTHKHGRALLTLVVHVVARLPFGPASLLVLQFAYHRRYAHCALFHVSVCGTSGKREKIFPSFEERDNL
jgi:hypothetical protein